MLFATSLQVYLIFCVFLQNTQWESTQLDVRGKYITVLKVPDLSVFQGCEDGPNAKGFKDYQGKSIRSIDFTLFGGIKSKKLAADIYRTFMTGINSRPMGSYANILNSSKAWDLSLYVLSLFRQIW